MIYSLPTCCKLTCNLLAPESPGQEDQTRDGCDGAIHDGRMEPYLLI